MPPVDLRGTTGNVMNKNMMASGSSMRSHSTSALPTAFKLPKGGTEKGRLDFSYVQEPKINNDLPKGLETIQAAKESANREPILAFKGARSTLDLQEKKQKVE